MLTLVTCGLLTAACSDVGRDPTSPDASLMLARLRASPLGLYGADSSLVVGDTVRINIGIQRNSLARRVVISFASADTSVAIVDRSGIVTARRPGKTVIQVRHGTTRDTYPIAVEARPSTASPTPDPVVPPQPPAPEDGRLPSFVQPAAPQRFVDLTMPTVTGRSRTVAANDAAALQRALDDAQPGDEIVLPDRATYVGNFLLPAKAAGGYVTLRSATLTTPRGTRVTPASASTFAKVLSPNAAPAIRTSSGTRGWRIVGLEIGITDAVNLNYGVVVLGVADRSVEPSPEAAASRIVLDRNYIRGSSTANVSRCVAFNGSFLALIDSWIAECHAKGFDSQGVGGWTGGGPFHIENNHIEGSGQNIMFGGADPIHNGLVPSDIVIRRNHLWKPMTWAGGRWSVKAAFELKNARRLVFEGNVIENHWADAQVGFAILMFSVNQDGTAPWSTVTDVLLRNNIVRNATSGANLSGAWSGQPVDTPLSRVVFDNNLFVNVGRDPVTAGPGRSVQILDGTSDVSLMRNTFLGGHAQNAVSLDGSPARRLTIANNVFDTTSWGVFGSGAGEGARALASFSPGGVFVGNVLTGRPSIAYPAGNFFPASLGNSFTNPSAGDFQLRQGLEYSLANGSLVGVSSSTLLTATAGVIR